MATYIKGNAVANATKYDLLEKNSDGTYTTLVEDASEIKFEVSALGLSEGDHTLVVVAQADGYEDSAYSNEVVYSASGESGSDAGSTGGGNAIEFTFDSTTENGVNLASAGTISNGVLTISSGSPIDYTGITFANDSDWTFECIGLPSTTTGLIPIGAGSTKGGFIQLPNPQGASTACIRFRDKDKTMSAEASWTTGFTAPTHFAVVYSATNKTLKMYMDYQELTVTYSTGSISTFESFTSTKLFGGYTDTYDYVGTLQYLRFSNSALSISDFHRE